MSEKVWIEFKDMSGIKKAFSDKKKGKSMREDNSRTFYYARVSARDQNLDRQIESFKAMGASERDIITDKESGKNLDRPGYQALRSTLLRRGDTLVIKSLDRLSRNKHDIQEELRYYQQSGIRVKILDLPTTMADLPENQAWVIELVNNILIEVLGTFAEQERTTIKARQAEGIAAAKAKGVRFGRPEKQLPDNFDEVFQQYVAKEISIRKAAKKCGIPPTTFRSKAARRIQQENGV